MLFAIILPVLLSSSTPVSAEEYQNPISVILKDKNVLSFVESYKKQGYDLYSIRNKRIALNCPEANDRSLIAYYMLMFVKMVNYRPTEKCWSDVSYNPIGGDVVLNSLVSCYPSSQMDTLQQGELTKIPYSFDGVSTQDIFGYTKEFKEVPSSSKKSSLFINTSTKEVKKGAMWDKNFTVSKGEQPNTFVISDASGKYRVTFDESFTKYDAVKI